MVAGAAKPSGRIGGGMKAPGVGLKADIFGWRANILYRDVKSNANTFKINR